MILGGAGAFILAIAALYARNGAFSGFFSRDGDVDDGSYNYTASGIGLHATDRLLGDDASTGDGDAGDGGSSDRRSVRVRAAACGVAGIDALAGGAEGHDLIGLAVVAMLHARRTRRHAGDR